MINDLGDIKVISIEFHLSAASFNLAVPLVQCVAVYLPLNDITGNQIDL